VVNPILDPSHALADRLKMTEASVAGMSTQPLLLNASTGQIGGGTPGLATDATGLQTYNSAGVLVNFLETSDGTMICFDNTGVAQARMGLLLSNPGNYGLEVWTGTAWQQIVSATTVAWSAITGKPSTFSPTVPIAGSNITGTVPAATTSSSCSGNAATATSATTAGSASTATNANHASDADGSSQAYNNNVGGTSFFAVWVGNNSGNTLGKNVSSIRYKNNVRAHSIDPAAVLQLQPVLFDRTAGPTTNEFGMIAEQVHGHVPEIVQWFEGEIDGLRYDLLPVAQQSVLQDHNGRISALESQLAAALERISSLETQVQAPVPQWSPAVPAYTTYTPPTWTPNVPAYAAPVPEPEPLPFTIQP
jgi:hypothetical protein